MFREGILGCHVKTALGTPMKRSGLRKAGISLGGAFGADNEAVLPPAAALAGACDGPAGLPPSLMITCRPVCEAAKKTLTSVVLLKKKLALDWSLTALEHVKLSRHGLNFFFLRRLHSNKIYVCART